MDLNPFIPTELALTNAQLVAWAKVRQLPIHLVLNDPADFALAVLTALLIDGHE